MLRIIVNGCFGRMGQVLSAAIASQDDMELVAGIDVKQGDGLAFPVFPSLASCSVAADVVIDFSHPDSLAALLPQAADKHLAMVIATTGLGENHRSLIAQYASRIPIFYSANMSLGINLVKDLIKRAASVLGSGFDIEIVEKHHRLKKDAPSGTALLLLQGLNEVIEPPLVPVVGRNSTDKARSSGEIGIHAVRGGTLVGDHDVIFAGNDELIQIGHVAYSRQIFASGATKAARYLRGRGPGLYTMDKMISETNVVTNLYTTSNEALITLGNIPAQMTVVTNLYGALSSEGVNIDMISHTPQLGDEATVSFTLFKDDLGKAEKVISEFGSHYPGVSYRCDQDIAKITVEGTGMEQQSGVAFKFFACLEKESIPVKAVSTSETKIAAVVNGSDKDVAVKLLKGAFLI